MNCLTRDKTACVQWEPMSRRLACLQLQHAAPTRARHTLGTVFPRKQNYHTPFSCLLSCPREKLVWRHGLTVSSRQQCRINYALNTDTQWPKLLPATRAAFQRKSAGNTGYIWRTRRGLCEMRVHLYPALRARGVKYRPRNCWCRPASSVTFTCLVEGKLDTGDQPQYTPRESCKRFVSK